MAHNEIQHRDSTTTGVRYFTIRNHNNQYWNQSYSEPIFEDLVIGNWSDYANPMTETPAGGYVFVANFPPEIVAERYYIDIFQQPGAVLINNTLEASFIEDWDGTDIVTLAHIVEDTDELQQMFADVDSTGTEIITAGNALEMVFALLGGNATYDTTTRTWTVYGRDGTTVLLTITISNSVYGTRTDSTLNS